MCKTNRLQTSSENYECVNISTELIASNSKLTACWRCAESVFAFEKYMFRIQAISNAKISHRAK